MKELFFPFCFNDFYIFKYSIVKICLIVVAQDSEFLQHERVTNNSLLKTVNISSETFLKGYRVFMVTLSLMWTIYIVLFKFVFTDNRCQFMDAKTPSC